MAWKTIFTKKAEKEFGKLPQNIQARIIKYLSTTTASDPFNYAENLSGNWAGSSRFRVGDYRIICEINSAELIVYVIKIGHRKDVY